MIILIFFISLLNDAIIFETEEERNLEIIVKDIEELKSKPMDINTAQFEELIKIPYLSIADVLKIIDYRKNHGIFVFPEDLLKIPGFDLLIFDKIRPFITTRVKKQGFERLTTRWRIETEVPGKHSSAAYYTRSQYIFNNHNIFLVTEKDPYENSFFDYYAAGLLIDEGVRRFAFGKYNLDFGSGVVLSPIGSFFQALDFRMLTSERGIIPYTSTLENSGFFGAALSDSLFIKYAIFYSNQKLDGTIDSLGFARSLYESGTHADSITLSRKDKINEEILGYDLRYQFSNLLVANRSYRCIYNPEFACRDSFSEFYGHEFWMTALDIKYFGEYFVIFSEWARAYKNRVGGLFGFSGFFPYFDFNLASKYFPIGFYSPKGIESDENYIGFIMDISHSSKIANLGLNLTIDNKIEDDSTRYGLRFYFEKKVGVVEARLQMRWRFINETRYLSGSRVFLRITPVKIIFFDLRLEEKNIYNQSGLERGVFGSLEFGVEAKKLQLRIRTGLFETDSYDSRIYVYERDLPGIINNRMLYGEGNYGFIYLSIKPIEQIGFAFKYSIMGKEALVEKHFGCQVDARL